MWYWIVAMSGEGQPFLRGPYGSPLRAQERSDKMEVDSRIVPLPTRDTARATRMLKEKRIDDFGLEEGTRMFKHGAMEGEIDYDSREHEKDDGRW